MHGPVQSMLAIAALLISSLPLHAQSNSTPRPSTDSSVTTGIGTGSSFKNVPSPTDQPPPENSRPVFWDTPEAHAKPPPDDGAKETNKETRGNGKAAGPPAAEVVEDPRTMITRDRIESPQH